MTRRITAERINAVGVFAEMPDVLRFSTVRKRLVAAGTPASALADLDADKEAAGSRCDVHGRLEDPVVGILNGRLAFACPRCSAPNVLAAWEAEGRREGAS